MGVIGPQLSASRGLLCSSSCETVEIEQFIFYDIDTIMSLHGSKSASKGVDLTTGGYNIKHPPGCT